jgi:hypothetical protein
MNGPNKLVLHYTGLERLAMDEQSNLMANLKVKKKIKFCEYGPSLQGPYSQRFIFCNLEIGLIN